MRWTVRMAGVLESALLASRGVRGIETVSCDDAYGGARRPVSWVQCNAGVSELRGRGMTPCSIGVGNAGRSARSCLHMGG
jgi:hypothetical protein